MRHPELHDLSIAHLDCDAFYAAVEKRDNPELRDRRATMGGWEEEVWYAKFRVARISERLGHDFDLVQRRYLEAYEFRPSRRGAGRSRRRAPASPRRR